MRIAKGTALLAAAVAAATALAGGAGASTTSVTITTPKAGQTVSLRKTPYLAVAGGVTFAASTTGTTRFYLRRDGCGTSNDNPHLSVAGGTDAGDGCGLIVNAVAGPGGDADQASFIDFPATDGMPLAYDGNDAINGVVSLTGGQVGIAYVDVALEALVGGQAVTVGTATGSALLDPTADHTPVPFTVAPNRALDGSDLQALDMRVHVHGPYVYSGFMSLSGNSYADVPSYGASVNKTVEVSVDDASFANAVPARIDSTSAGWSVALPTPAIGKHTIYARSTQGFDESAPASVALTVTK
jgi:hypothetical protein